VDVRKSPKSMAKLMKQCKRTKEILSANAEAPISVESIHGEVDFRSSITRGARPVPAAFCVARSVGQWGAAALGVDETIQIQRLSRPQGRRCGYNNRAF
jgi:hypothetical protein